MRICATQMNKYWKYDVFAVVLEVEWNKEREKKEKQGLYHFSTELYRVEFPWVLV